MFVNIVLLYGQSQPVGEKLFVGAICGAITTFIIWLIQKRDKKKEVKEEKKQQQLYTRQVQRDIASDFSSNHDYADVDYIHLYNELKAKCDPANFMNPYNSKKVEISNSIYSQLDIYKYDIDALIRLRNLAIKELGLSFSTTALFNRLCRIYNPSNFMGVSYDAKKLSAANKIYGRILQNKDNIIELERIAKENNVSHHKKVMASKNVSPDGANSNSEGASTYTVYVLILILLIILCIYFSNKPQ